MKTNDPIAPSVVTVTRDTLAKLQHTSTVAAPVIKGLGRKKWAFVIAPPGVGKTKFATSLAYEAATTVPLLGLLPEGSRPLKVLFWPSEDGVAELSARMLVNLDAFSHQQEVSISQNLHIYDSDDAFFCAPNAPLSERSRCSKAIEDFIAVANSVGADLIIIDCLRSIKGTADEVTDHSLINVGMRQIAKNTNAGCVMIHHPIKAVTRDPTLADQVCGSGMSDAQSESKLQFFLAGHVNRQTGEVSNRLYTKKGNHLPAADWFNDHKLLLTEHDLMVNPDVYQQRSVSTPLQSVDSAPATVPPLKQPQRKRSRQTAAKGAKTLTPKPAIQAKAIPACKESTDSPIFGTSDRTKKIKSKLRDLAIQKTSEKSG